MREPVCHGFMTRLYIKIHRFVEYSDPFFLFSYLGKVGTSYIEVNIFKCVKPLKKETYYTV